MPLAIAEEGLINKNSRKTIVYMMISSNKPSKPAILMEEAAGEHYGTSFDCIAKPERDQCL